MQLNGETAAAQMFGDTEGERRRRLALMHEIGIRRWRFMPMPLILPQRE